MAARAATVGAALALPVLWELFRMGYYAMLVHNTTLAKEAALARWDQGWRYFVDTVGTYYLAVPLLVVALFVAPRVATAWRVGQRTVAALVAAPIAVGLVQWVYVIRVGGDFMHGRVLLPGLFAILLPAAALRVSRRQLVGFAALGVWALLVGTVVRVPYRGDIGPAGIADERGVYAGWARRAHPVAADDYARWVWLRRGRDLRRLAAQGKPVLILGERGFADAKQRLPLRSSQDRPVAVFTSVGMLSFAAGVDVHVVDQLALGDVIASHQRVDVRGRPGHEKLLHLAWAAARFADPSAPPPPLGPTTAETAAARRALRCEPLAELFAATQDRLSTRRFMKNMGAALRLHHLRFSPSPVVAVQELCGGSA
ncbi:MAG: hypothetical protein M3P85_16415 [Actinomycetota bacterium]|nr:hypothetical protein [Actinomycetota bacterium]